MRARDLQPKYEAVCSRYGMDALVPRRMRDHLNELAMLGIVESIERNKGESGGRYYEYDIGTDVELLVEALEDTIDEMGQAEFVQERLGQK